MATDDTTYADLVEEIRRMREDINKANGLLETIAREVAPAIEAISASPIGKMFGMRKAN